MMMHKAFTLLELLLVMVIILIIASLLVVGLDLVEKRRDRLVTTQRIENVLNTLARVGMGSGSITLELQTKVTGGIGGTSRFERGVGFNSNPYVMPSDADGDGSGDDWHRVYPDSAAVPPNNELITASGDGAPLVMAYPWGQQRRYRIGNWDDSGDGDYWYYNLYENRVSGSDVYPAPEKHRVHELWPRKSAEIMTFLEVCADVEDYQENRNPKQPWNDAWGMPLVIAYALYQPPEYKSDDVGVTRYPDYYLQQAKQEYQYNRSVFVTVGAPGPDITPYSIGADWNGNLTGLWDLICEVTMPNEADWWDEDSFNDNPWAGIHYVEEEGSDRECYISAPVEYK